MSQPEPSPDTEPSISIVPPAEQREGGVDASSPSPSTQATQASTQTDADKPSETGEGKRVPLWLFALTCVVLVAGLGWQLHRMGTLEGQIADLEQHLRQKEALLGAHRSHLSEIRDGVADLATRLGGLQALTEVDPELGVRAPSPPQELSQDAGGVLGAETTR